MLGARSGDGFGSAEEVNEKAPLLRIRARDCCSIYDRATQTQPFFPASAHSAALMQQFAELSPPPLIRLGHPSDIPFLAAASAFTLGKMLHTHLPRYANLEEKVKILPLYCFPSSPPCLFTNVNLGRMD